MLLSAYISFVYKQGKNGLQDPPKYITSMHGVYSTNNIKNNRYVYICVWEKYHNSCSK